MPITAKVKPVAANENEIGKPDNRKNTKPTNISGAIYSIKNSMCVLYCDYCFRVCVAAVSA